MYPYHTRNIPQPFEQNLVPSSVGAKEVEAKEVKSECETDIILSSEPVAPEKTTEEKTTSVPITTTSKSQPNQSRNNNFPLLAFLLFGRFLP